MDKQMLMLIVLVVMVIFSLFQAVQLTSLKQQIVDGELQVGKGSGTTVAGNAGGSAFDSLPGMVGGC